MKNKINNSLLLGLGAVGSLSLLVGNTFASFIVTPAPQLGTRITIAGIPTHEVTYYLPTNASGSTYTSHVVEVNEGTNLYEALDEYTTDVGGYGFTSWHLSNDEQSLRTDGTNYARDLVANSLTVDSDITVYAKYVQNNVGYYYTDGHHYLTSSTSEVAMNAPSFYYGTRIYSLNGVEGSEIQLGINKPGDKSSDAHYNNVTSGVFSFYKNANDWTVKRVVTISVNDVSWWFDGEARTHVYVVATSGNYWVDKFLPQNSSDKAKNLEVGLDASAIIVTRGKFDTGGWKDDTKGSDTCWNQTIDITFTYDGGRLDSDANKGTVYGYNHSTIYISDTESGGKKIYSWW